MNMSRMHWNSYGSSRNQHVAQLIMLIAAAAIAVPTAATLAEGERSGPEVVAFKDFAGTDANLRVQLSIDSNNRCF
eukprot:SAG31_NODE_66_length_28567_cov_30.222698_15_plen_76_part_00